MPRPVSPRPGNRPQAPSPAHEVVDPVWLAKAFLLMVLVALVCGYLTLCLLFYKGQWQLVLHPSRTSTPPATAGGVPFQLVRFGAGATGIPELSGWWIPAVPGTALSQVTLLFLPGADGSLSGDQALLADLHDAGASIFAVDYRGYGQSADIHPSERTMRDDAHAALNYLNSSRGLATSSIVPYGRGIGASLALELASTSAGAPGVILDSPDFNVESRIAHDPRSRLLPVHLLFHDTFQLQPALQQSRIPKLILTRDGREDPAVRTAAEPRMTVALPPSANHLLAPAVTRFLDQYVPPSQAPAPGSVSPALLQAP